MSRPVSLLVLAMCAASFSGARADSYGIDAITPDWLTALGAYQRGSSYQPGHEAYSIDQQAYLSRDGTTLALGAPLRHSDGFGLVPGYIDVFGLDYSDRVYGIGSVDPASRCITCNSMWMWDGSWEALGTGDIFYSVGQMGGPPVVNESGQIAGHWGGSGTPFIWSGGAFTGLSVPLFSSVLSNDINNSGQALFYVADGMLNRNHYLYYANGQAQWISDLISGSTGWDLMHAQNVQLLESGYMVGRAPYNGVETEFVLAPEAVPEPGSASLVLLGSILGAVWWRFRAVKVE